MRSQCALYVDAGYLLGSAATRATGTSLRTGIAVEYALLIDALADHATRTCGLPLMRVHWYDAARNGVPDKTQEDIGLLPQVKIRLGRIRIDGEQKGVDLRIGLDMVNHARNGAVDMIYLVSGDDDLSVAVEEAQNHGVLVTVVAVPTNDGAPHGVSRHLSQVADALDVLDGELFDAAIAPVSKPYVRRIPSGAPRGDAAASSRRRPASAVPSVQPSRAVSAAPSVQPSPAVSAAPPLAASSPPGPAAPESEGELVYSSTTGAATTISPRYGATAAELRDAADQITNKILDTWLNGSLPEQRKALLTSRPSIPQEVDRTLLLDVSERLQMSDLPDWARHLLRLRFWQQFDHRDNS
jgi:hypothetical protein